MTEQAISASADPQAQPVRRIYPLASDNYQTTTTTDTASADNRRLFEATIFKTDVADGGAMSSQERDIRAQFRGIYGHEQMNIANPEVGLKAQSGLPSGGAMFTYNPALRDDGLRDATRIRLNGMEVLTRNFEGRQDGMLSERIVGDPLGTMSTRRFLDGTREIVQTNAAGQREVLRGRGDNTPDINIPGYDGGSTDTAKLLGSRLYSPPPVTLVGSATAGDAQQPGRTTTTPDAPQPVVIIGDGQPAATTPAPAGSDANQDYLTKFRKRLEDNNVALPEIQKGWGPYQALQKLVSDGKLNIPVERLQAEAVRIRDREFAKHNKRHFSRGDQMQLFSKEEIDKLVADETQRIKNGGTPRDLSNERALPQFDAPVRPADNGGRTDPDNGDRSRPNRDRGRRRGADTRPPNWQPDPRNQPGSRPDRSEFSGTRTRPGRRYRPEDFMPRPRNGRDNTVVPGSDTVVPGGTSAPVDTGDYLALARPQGSGGDMPMRSLPTISAAQIDRILQENRSPAARERITDRETGQQLTFGQHLYKLGLQYGINPAIALAFFKAESTFGRFGKAARTRSFGNIKGRGRGGFRSYDSFADGARDWFQLINDNYINKGRRHLGPVLEKYAPRSENNTAGYIRGVASDVHRWARASQMDPNAGSRSFDPNNAPMARPRGRGDGYQQQPRGRRGQPSNGRYRAEDFMPRSYRRQVVDNRTRGDAQTAAFTQASYTPPRIEDRSPTAILADRSPTATLASTTRPEVSNPGEQTPRPEERRDSTDRRRQIVRVKAGESIQRAIDRAPEGAVIQVEPGVYKERLRINRDNITLQGDGRAVLDLDGKSISGAAINISGRKGVTIDGFEIRNVRGGELPTGIRVDGDSRDIALLNNNIHHVESSRDAHGIAVYGTSATPLRNVRIEGNQIHHLKLGTSESVVLNGNVDGFRISGNKIHDNDNIGIDIIGGEGTGRAGIDRARNGVIANNQLYNIDTMRNPAYGNRSAAAIYVDGGSDVVIEDNTIRGSNYGIELASERRGWNTERVQVRRNRIEGSHLAGISLGGGSRSNGGVTASVVENNDLRGNSRPVWKQNHVGADVIVRNNQH